MYSLVSHGVLLACVLLLAWRSVAAESYSRQPTAIGSEPIQGAGRVADEGRHPEYPSPQPSQRLQVGHTPTEAEIAAWDIDVRADGKGLPAGRGDIAQGERLYGEKCALCHGDFGQGEGRWPALAGGIKSLTEQGGDLRPHKTVGSYWPYAPVVFDYIRRAMPYTAPQSLSAEETYALTAYVLYLNELVEEDFVADRKSLSAFKMPNRDNFYPDPRPDVQNSACMKDCKSEKGFVVHAIRGVTPEQELRAAAEVPQSQPPREPSAGKVVYNSACSVCHQAGLAGAPKIGRGRKALWAERLKLAGSEEQLVGSVLQGKGSMPANGGNPSLSEADIRQAVGHMLRESR